jgi:hypothetical protein
MRGNGRNLKLISARVWSLYICVKILLKPSLSFPGHPNPIQIIQILKTNSHNSFLVFAVSANVNGMDKKKESHTSQKWRAE